MHFLKFTFILLLIFFHFTAQCQFNQQLDLEIRNLGDKFSLDSIAKINGRSNVRILDSISSRIDNDLVQKHLIGGKWKYSHSVYADGRKYRSKNAIGLLKFDDPDHAYFLWRYATDTSWCDWSYSPEKQLSLKKYKSKEKLRTGYPEKFNIHSITDTRLVLSGLMVSKKYRGTSTVIFRVYFRPVHRNVGQVNPDKKNDDQNYTNRLGSVRSS